MFKKKTKILVVRQLGGVGDCLSMGCVYLGLKEKYPESHITCITSDYLGYSLVEIARHNPFIDEVKVIPYQELTTSKTKEVWPNWAGNALPIEDELFWKKADLTVDLNSACVEYEWPAIHDGGVRKPRYQIWCEKAEVVPSSYKPIYVITDKERHEAMNSLYNHGWKTPDHTPKLIGLGLSAISGKNAVNRNLLHEIGLGLKEFGHTVITIDQTLRLDGLDSIIGLPINKLMPLISLMDAVISVDSGLLHMAGTVGTPVVGLFANTDPDMRMKMYKGVATVGSRLVSCSPCWYNYKCLNDRPENHYACMNKIDPEMVITQAIRLLNNPRYTELSVIS